MNFLPIKKSEVDTLAKELSDAELDLQDELQNSKRLAWRVTTGAFVFAFGCLALTGAVVYRYSQPVPASILAYNTSDPASIQEVSLTADKKSYGEVEDAYWMSQFAISYESYDYGTIGRYYNQVGLMAKGAVSDSYKAIYEGKDARDKLWGNSRTIKTEIISVLLDQATGTATVRFKTTQRDLQKSMPEPSQYWIATAAYKYVQDPMTASQRMLNPLGFKVTSYTKRPEAGNSVAGG
ncbi:virB8 family protein [Paraburkholderia sp. GAS32]|uniref:virB8 family protein n=1 Tax=Paraburkholderia sp. GAS32 TaxID=3035129 RepID=UPI003D1E87F7